MSAQVCPVCGSPNLTSKVENVNLYENFGGQLAIEKKFYVCSDCGTEGDFFGDNEEVEERALQVLKDNVTDSILESFAATRVSFAAIERALDLPQRTLTKWKNHATSPTATGIALLKYLKLFPWLLEVAENNFEYSVSQKIFMSNALKKFIDKMASDESEFREAGVFTTPNTAFFYFQMQKTDVATPSYAQSSVRIS